MPRAVGLQAIAFQLYRWKQISVLEAAKLARMTSEEFMRCMNHVENREIHAVAVGLCD